MYPRSEGTTFDIDYYLSHHMPLVQEELGDVLKGVGVDEGMGGDHPAPYHAICYLTFDSVEAFFGAMGGATRTREDVSNFTNATPQIQISEVRL
jgi:uncharacterized protein (TIGR02118 family)